MSWKLSAIDTKERVEAALEKRDMLPHWDDAIVLTGFEVDPDDGTIWQLDAYCEDMPGAAETEAVASLFEGDAPEISAEELPDLDWVVESQKGVDPIRAGRFRVRTPEHAALDEPGVTEFVIPAAQAFGTGQHATTAGCLTMLDRMHAEGVSPKTLADIGTGTGLLAFAAMDLWPQAIATASDIDPVCGPAVVENCELNDVAMGSGPGELSMVIADGMDDQALQARAPFDLLIANILAAPLIEMAQDFAGAVAPGGSILLAGLLETQEDKVRAAYDAAGFCLRQRLVNGDWSILWLRPKAEG